MRTPIKSEQQDFFEKVKRHAGPGPFEPQWEEMATFEELKAVIEQMRQMGYSVQDAANVIKQAS